MVETFETLLIGLMEKESESETVYLSMKQEDPNSLAVNLANFLNQLTHDGHEIITYTNILRRILLDIFNHSFIDLDVKIVALKAMVEFIKCVGCSAKDREKFQILLPYIMKMLTDALVEKKLEAAVQCELEILIDLAKNEPRFFRTQLVDVINTMFEIVECESYEKKTRHIAVVFMLTLAEAKEKAPGMMNKYLFFTYKFFAVLLKLLEEVDHADDAWDTLYPVFEKKCIERLCNAVGGKTMSPIALEQVLAYLDHDDAEYSWPKLYAALVALAAIAKACSEAITKVMKGIVNLVMNCMGHSHPGVKVAALQAIRHLTATLSSSIQELSPDLLLPALIGDMDDANALVQVFVFRAIAEFFNPKMELHFISYRDPILDKLRELLSKGLNYKGYTEIQVHSIQDSAITLLLKMTTKDLQSFRPYHNTPKARHLEMTTLFVAYWDNRDLEQNVKFLTSFPQSNEEDDDAAHLQLKLLEILCEFYGQHLLPHMSILIPVLFQYAQLVPDKNILSADSDIFNSGDDSFTSCRTRKIEREEVRLWMKARACGALANLAETQKEDFYPWISQTASVLVPAFKSYSDCSFRNEAVYAMLGLLRCAKLADEKGIAQGGDDELNFMQLSDIIILSLLEVLNEEPETFTPIMLYGLYHCVQICRSLLNEGQVCKIMEGIKQVITKISNRKRQFTESAKTEDFDRELLRKEKEKEDEIFSVINQIVHTLIETFKDAFFPFFDELSSYLIPLWDKDKTAQVRFTIFYIFAYLVAKCPEAVQRYRDVYLPILLDASNDEIPEARQNALYGLGVYAEYGGSVFKPFVKEAISRINVVIMHFRACKLFNNEDNEEAYDNAVSALGKICHFHRESIDSTQIIPLWMNCLPIKRVLLEAKYVHEELCLMVERLDKELFDPNYQYIPKIISNFAEVLCSDEDLDEETANRIINVLRHLQQTLPSTTWESAWSYLLPHHVMELKSILSPQEVVNF